MKNMGNLKHLQKKWKTWGKIWGKHQMFFPWFSLFCANTVSCCRAPREQTDMAHFQYCRNPIHPNSQRSWRGAPGRIWQTLRDNSRRSCKPIPVGVARAWITRSGNQGETRRRRQICLTSSNVFCMIVDGHKNHQMCCTFDWKRRIHSLLFLFSFVLFQGPLLNKTKAGWTERNIFLKIQPGIQFGLCNFVQRLTHLCILVTCLI